MFMLLFSIANLWGYLGLPINKGLDEENVIQLAIVDFSMSQKEEQYYVICRKRVEIMILNEQPRVIKANIMHSLMCGPWILK